MVLKCEIQVQPTLTGSGTTGHGGVGATGGLLASKLLFLDTSLLNFIEFKAFGAITVLPNSEIFLVKTEFLHLLIRQWRAFIKTFRIRSGSEAFDCHANLAIPVISCGIFV